MNNEKLTPQELAEQELANKIVSLINEQKELIRRRGSGVTLEKNEYIGERTSELETEIDKLKKDMNTLKSPQTPQP